MRRFLPVALALAAAACSVQRGFEVGGPTDLLSMTVPFQTVTLDNGLRVVLNEDHHTPIVAVNLMYEVGWSDDPLDKPSLAHFFEHLMFQGSAHVPGGGHFRHLELAGAHRIDAVTAADTTEYFETIPANQLELALWLESDRMGFMLDALDQEKLDRVRPVVDNEIRQRQENAVDGRILEFVRAAAFPQGHPYHIDRGQVGKTPPITLADVKQFGRTYYLPNNASLALSGDFDAAVAVAFVDRYFGSFPPGPKPPRHPAAPTSLAGTTVLLIAAAVARDEVVIAWPTPGLGQEGDAELDLVAYTLNESFLPRTLVQESPIAVSARASHVSWQRGGLFVIDVVLRPGWTTQAALQAVDKQLQVLREFRVRRKWSQRAGRAVLTEVFQDTLTAAGRAARLNLYNLLMQNPGYLLEEVRRHEAATPSDVMAAVERYLPPQKRVVAFVRPDASAPVGGRLVEKP